MENADCTQSVRVAVNIRPLITSELLLGCTDCISVAPGEPQVLYYLIIFHGLFCGFFFRLLEFENEIEF